MTGNKTSRYVWAYQTAAGTSAIDDATDQTYFFGMFPSDAKWETASMNADSEAYWAYASREPSLTALNPKFNNLKIGFLPTTGQVDAWFYGQVTEDGVGANVHKVEVLDTGLNLPQTVRLEMNDGSVDRRIQVVDAYGVGLYSRAMYNAPFFQEIEYAYGLIDNGEETLTQAPAMPGYSAITTVYDGTPDVYWDTGDDNIHLTECWKAEWINTQEYETVLNSAGTQQTVYLYKHQPVGLTLDCILERTDVWTDHIARNVHNITVQVYKPTVAYYKKYTFTNCHIINVKETGSAYKGHFNARITLKAESSIVAFTHEAETNWSTHYKHVA